MGSGVVTGRGVGPTSAPQQYALPFAAAQPWFSTTSIDVIFPRDVASGFASGESDDARARRTFAPQLSAVPSSRTMNAASLTATSRIGAPAATVIASGAWRGEA